MAAVAGLRGTGDWGTDERPKNFRELILWRNPNGAAPFFALMSKVRKESTNDPEFSWWDEPQTLVRLRTNGALTNVQTSVVVDSADPDAANPEFTWGLATHLKPGDLLLVEPTADNEVFNHEIIAVASVQSATQFTATRGAAGTTAAAIPDNSNLLLLGSHYAEGTRAPDAVSRNPQKYFNYTQIWKDSYELTGTGEQTHTRTGDPVKNDKKRKMWDHSRGIELSLLFGQRSEGVGSNGKPIRTTAGLRSLVGHSHVFTVTPTISTSLDAISPVFDWESPAGNQRIAFCGNGTLNSINKMIQTDANSQIQWGGMIKQFGMELTELRLPQGTIFLRTHPLMNRHALYNNGMFLVDFSSIRWRPMRGRDTKFKDNVQENDADSRRGYWQTEAGLEVHYGGLTNAYIGGWGA